jgi:sec-independent protein translocase protein TatC
MLGIVVAGAVLTPPDVFSQLVLAGALLLLYLASIVVCRLLYRKRRAE